MSKHLVRGTAVVLALAVAACSGKPAGGNGSAPAVPAPMVQPLPQPSSTGYPPCSATIRDHCTQR